MLKELNNLKEEQFYHLTHENAKKHKGESGVYGLFFNKELIYIGQSKDFSKRLSSHSRKDAFSKSLAKQEEGIGDYQKAINMYKFIDENRENIFFYILSNDINEEKDYIEYYRPKYNYKGVDVPYNCSDIEEIHSFYNKKRKQTLEKIRKLKEEKRLLK